MNTLTVFTPIGPVRLCQEWDEIVSAVCIDQKEETEDHPTPLLLEAKRQIEEYFSGVRSAFDLPLRIRGTVFEQAVYRELLKIPCGETRMYGELAQIIGRPGAARAVGRACGRNPLLILVPCHRVVGIGGRLTGFAAGTEAKKILLSHERQMSRV